MQLDISEKKSVEEFKNNFLKKHSNFDILVNNAGTIEKRLPSGKYEIADLQTASRVLSTNFSSTVEFTE